MTDRLETQDPRDTGRSPSVGPERGSRAARQAAERRKAVRNSIIAIASTLTVFLALAYAIVNAPNWPAVEARFFDVPRIVDSVPDLLEGFLTNVGLFLVAELLVLVVALDDLLGGRASIRLRAPVDRVDVPEHRIAVTGRPDDGRDLVVQSVERWTEPWPRGDVDGGQDRRLGPVQLVAHGAVVEVAEVRMGPRVIAQIETVAMRADGVQDRLPLGRRCRGPAGREDGGRYVVGDQPGHDVHGRLQPAVHVERQGDRRHGPVAMAHDQAGATDRRRRVGRPRGSRRLRRWRGGRSTIKRRWRRLEEFLLVDLHVRDQAQHPADDDPVRSILGGFRIERWIGGAIPERDAEPRRRIGARDRREGVAGTHDVDEERGQRGRGRAHEGWSRRRAGRARGGGLRDRRGRGRRRGFPCAGSPSPRWCRNARDRDQQQAQQEGDVARAIDHGRHRDARRSPWVTSPAGTHLRRRLMSRPAWGIGARIR